MQPSLAVIDCKPHCSEVEQQQHKEMDNQQYLNDSRVDIQQGDDAAGLASLDQAQSILKKHFESRAENANNTAT
jgi:hypothetical protein